MSTRAGVAKCNTCVCGCPKTTHRRVSLSVPLPPREDGPLYKIGAGVHNNPRASRFTEQCGCGCMRFEVEE